MCLFHPLTSIFQIMYQDLVSRCTVSVYNHLYEHYRGLYVDLPYSFLLDKDAKKLNGKRENKK